ncbi:MAG: rRNA maturation RNase YbeY [Clostridia bacterium]|nr:rRNA maturation RNase YbeY [Clostridia bacterium]
MSLKVIFDNDQEQIALTYKTKLLVRRAIEETLDYEQYSNPCEVSVTFTDNEGIHKLNRQYRGVDRPTDVLSFPLFDYDGVSEEPPVDELMGMLGDIVLSLEQAQKQAEEYGHSFEREVAFLCVHSMLHLLGYDHLDEGPQKAQMRAREEAIAASIPRMSRN